MKTRKIVIGAALTFIALPLALVLIAVGAYYASFYSVPRATGTIVSSGHEREYLLYVPRRYDHTRPTPLVISLHAAMLWPAHQRETTHWDKLAEEPCRLSHRIAAVAVLLYTLQGGGHAWPGGKPLPEWLVGPTSRNIDATAQMWAFFRGHQLTT
jgi:poly(3-hydroxybutyrate) depolymerase